MIPAMKPDGRGGYEFCPKCAAMWGLIILALGAGVWFFLRRKGSV